MKSEFLTNCCRICLGRGRKLRSLYTPTEEGELPPNEMLQLIAGISLEKVEENLAFPKNICKNCDLSLTMAYEFRNKALENQKLLALLVKKSPNNEISVEDGQLYLTSVTAANTDQENVEDSDLIAQNQELDAEDIEVHPMMDLDVLVEDTTASLLLQEEYERDTADELSRAENDDRECAPKTDSNTVAQAVQGVYVANIELNQTEEEEDGDEEAIYELKGNFVGEDMDDVIVVDEEAETLEVTDDNLMLEEHLETLDTLSAKTNQLMEQNVDNSNDVNIKEDLRTDINDSALINSSRDNESHSHYENESKAKQVSPKRKAKNCTKVRLINDEINLIAMETGENSVEKNAHKRKHCNNSKRDKFNYICDICGNVYDKRSRMMEHRQRHDKELKYICELCDMKFHMRELLRKHMYLHSGGKPYKCDYCSRSFYYESVLKTHMDVHRGLRPYVCKICGKSFSYSHALKKHELIHAEIKLYRCLYCKKDFRLQHHMKQHTLTKMHKNVVKLAVERGEYLSDSNDAKDEAPAQLLQLTKPLLEGSKKTITTATTTTRIQIEPDDRRCKVRIYDKSKDT